MHNTTNHYGAKYQQMKSEHLRPSKTSIFRTTHNDCTRKENCKLQTTKVKTLTYWGVFVVPASKQAYTEREKKKKKN